MNTANPNPPDTTVVKKPLVYKISESAPSILRQVLDEMGWTSQNNEITYWNLYWKGSRFTSSEYSQCQPFQRMNHFQSSGCLTKKESLNRLLRTLKHIYGNIYDFFPESYCLPSEYKKFLREYQNDVNLNLKQIWIAKPVDLSRGRGIFIIKELHELRYDSRFVKLTKHVDPKIYL
jgi:tubulin polyglutamylase TTLL2